jgi:serine/threonine-protein kinase
MKTGDVAADATAAREVSDAEVVRWALDWKLCEQKDLRELIQRRKAHPTGEPLVEQLRAEGLVTARQAERLLAEIASGEKSVEQIPGYQLLGRIGSGGMGVVYKARQLRMDRLVAIKMLKPKLSNNARYVERFLREAKVAAKLSHNHIVQAIDAGEAYGHHYLVMEYVEGRTAAQLVAERGPFEERDAVRIVWQIAQALDHSHKRKMLHRDIKPENIIITTAGDAKLADMGLARMREDADVEEAERGLIVGTVYYISPEQIRGEAEIDIRADIYSLGGALYTMLAGQQPFQGEHAREVLVKHLEDMPTPLNRLPRRLSDGVSVVVETMMAKAKHDRYPTPADLIFDLECLLANKPPRLAQERVSLRTLAELAKGEPLADRSRSRQHSGVHRRAEASGGWLVALLAVLAVSLACNLAQWLFR